MGTEKHFGRYLVVDAGRRKCVAFRCESMGEGQRAGGVPLFSYATEFCNTGSGSSIFLALRPGQATKACGVTGRSDEMKVRQIFSLDPAVLKKLQSAAKAESLPVSTYLNRILTLHLLKPLKK